MNELEKIILQQSRIYETSKPQDMVKLLFQNEFGPGHMIHDFETALSLLKKEYETLKATENLPVAEYIGNGYSRLFPGRLDTADYPPEFICRLFVSSSGRTDGNLDSFLSKLGLLKKLCRQGCFSFSPNMLDAYLNSYQAQGYPMVSHSPAYKKAYHPFYRIIDSRYETFLPFFAKIHHLIAEKGNAVVAVDGNCAAGKTTCAELLSKLFECSVIHMDDFFLPPDLRTQERYSETGGNIHYERFEKEVLAQLNQASFTYRVYDCAVCGYTHSKTVTRRSLTVIEGAYAMHPRFQRYYDLSLFLKTAPEEQEKRILERNGGTMLPAFKTMWIPMENKYFEHFHIQDICDCVISS